MKIEMFHLCPYRNLPKDFRENHRSVWVDPSVELFDPDIAEKIYRDTLDEIILAAESGFHGVCVNEHHQNAYGMMPSPNLMGSIIARETEDVAVIIMGNSIALYNPPIRVAEEFAMLDCISGGRLVAGFPLGTAMDTVFSYGVNPASIRNRYNEAEDLIKKAWTKREVFSFNGEYTKLRYVNIWPRPKQKPYPPIWIPGSGSIETWGTCLDKGYLYAYLSYSGYKRGKQVMDGFWKLATQKGVNNPYHAGFLQLVCIGDNEKHVKELYAEPVEYFFNKMLHIYPGFSDAPGYRTMKTIKAGLMSQTTSFGGPAWKKELTFDDLREAGNVVAGTPDQVVSKLREVIKDLRIGHLMILNQFGSMPHDIAKYNIKRCASEIVPQLEGIWNNYEDKWWPQYAKSPS